MGRPVTLIRSDGAEGENADAVRRVLECSGAVLAWAEFAPPETPLAGDEAVVASMLETRVCLDVALPPAGVAPAHAPAAAVLGAVLGLDVCAHPCKSYAGVPDARSSVDLIVFRSTAEGPFRGLGHRSREPEAERLAAELDVPDEPGLTILSETRAAAARVVESACAFAREHGRKRLSVCHQAALLPHTDGLFLHTARNVAVRYPDVGFESRSLGEVGSELARAPDRLDVLVVPAVFGSLVAEFAAGLVGGPRFAPSFHLGEDVAVFGADWPVVPPSPGARMGELPGPWSVMLAGMWMLRHLGEGRAAARLERAIAGVLAAGGTAPGSPSELADELVAELVAGT